MRNKKIVLIIIIFIIICITVYIFIRIVNPTIRAVVVRADEKYLTIMNIKDEGLYNISIADNSLKFKKGQEILVYCKYDSFIEQTNPASIKSEDIKKIKILKEKSNIEIPNKELVRIYNSGEKVLISINEISQTGISITIKDTNEFKHEYKHSNYYKILKKNGSTYSEPARNNNIKTTVDSIRIDNNNTIKNTYNWENLYGKLESGEYQLKTATSDYYMNIFIDFTIDENGEITYSKAECGIMF